MTERLILRATCRRLRQYYQKPSLVHRHEASSLLHLLDKDRVMKLCQGEGRVGITSTAVCAKCRVHHTVDDFSQNQLDLRLRNVPVRRMAAFGCVSVNAASLGTILSQIRTSLGPGFTARDASLAYGSKLVSSI